MLKMKLNYLNNKGLIDDNIKNLWVCMCVCVCLSALDLRNGVTQEYEIFTAYWCGNSSDTQGFIFKICYFFFNYNQITFFYRDGTQFLKLRAMRGQRSGKGGGMLLLTVRQMRDVTPTCHQQGYQKLSDIPFPGI